MLDVVLSYASAEDPMAIFGRDSHGNTLLHLCVLHDLFDMYKHVQAHALAIMHKQIELVQLDPIHNQYGYSPMESKLKQIPGKLDSWIHSEAKRKVGERLSLVLNEDFHSPLTLAASSGGFKMLQFLIDQLKTVRWTYGPVSVSLLDLDGLEMPHNKISYLIALKDCEEKLVKSISSEFLSESQMKLNNIRKRIVALEKADLHGAIEWLCINPKKLDFDTLMPSFEIPFIKDIVDTKWKKVCIQEFLPRCYLCISCNNLADSDYMFHK